MPTYAHCATTLRSVETHAGIDVRPRSVGDVVAGDRDHRRLAPGTRRTGSL